MKKLIIGAALGALTTSAGIAQDWDKVEVTSEPVAGSVHVLYGAGGNIGVSVGDDGVYIIDDQYAPLTDKIRAAISALSDKPIRFAINTHYHGDHTGGNENLGATGTVIMAHDNVRVRLTAGSFIKAFNMKTEPKTGAALPVVTFNDEISLHLNGEEARVIHVANAHTDGDSIVHFRGSNVIHMGDTFFDNRFPFIDVSGGGSIGGVIKTAKTALAIADDATKIIPGHGKVTDKAGLEAYLAMLNEVRTIIGGLKAEGKTLEEIQAMAPLSGFDAKWQTNNENWPSMFIEFVYTSL